MKPQTPLASTTHPKTLAVCPITTGAARLLFLLLLLFALPVAVRAQFRYTTDNGQITITGYNTDPGGAVNIPSAIGGLPVTRIGDHAFAGNGLTSVTIPDSVTTIVLHAFFGCTSLTKVYFQGNAPAVGLYVFGSGFGGDPTPTTIYHFPETTGWGSTWAGRPTAFWSLPNPVILGNGSTGVQNNRFGFTISWATGQPVGVEACTDFANPVWTPVGTNTLTGGSSYFSDPQWAEHRTRLYRLRSP